MGNSIGKVSLKISVITAVRNSRGTIGTAIDSVRSQSYANLEYITVDGMSNDGTEEEIRKNATVITRSIRESDTGIYDALNKGLRAATGDVIGFLHADDFLASEHVVSRIADKFQSGDLDVVYGDLVYVKANAPEITTRYWRSGTFRRSRFRRGWMPPHPTVYVRREIYEQCGMYRTDIGSQADYECLLRLMFCHSLRVGYIPEVLVKMRQGGESNVSLRNRLRANVGDREAWKVNGLRPPFGLRFTKPLSKIPQYFRKPPNER